MSNDTKRYQDRQKFIAEAARSKESEQPLVTGDLATQRAIHDSCNGKEQPTPRTDAALSQACNGAAYRWQSWKDHYKVAAALARQLERELADMTAVARTNGEDLDEVRAQLAAQSAKKRSERDVREICARICEGRLAGRDPSDAHYREAVTCAKLIRDDSTFARLDGSSASKGQG